MFAQYSIKVSSSFELSLTQIVLLAYLLFAPYYPDV